MSTYSAIAALLGGVNSGLDNRRAQDEQERIRQQQEADRQRQQRMEDERMAATRADMMRSYIGQQIAVGNHQGAASVMPLLYENLNTVMHTNLKGPEIKGATVVGQRAGGEQMRPTPGFVGPMPVATETRTHQDFSGSATKRALMAAAGIAPEPIPQPKVQTQAYANGRIVAVTTHADGRVEYKEVRPPDAPAAPAPRASGGGARPRSTSGRGGGGSSRSANWQTKVVWEGGKRIIYAFNPQTRDWVNTGREAPPTGGGNSGGGGNQPPWVKKDAAPAPVAQTAEDKEFAAWLKQQKR